MSTIKTKMASLKSVSAGKKIESPYAKYNSTGQLFCVVCNVQIKNEMYWIGHINGKAHRDTVTLLKNKGKVPAPPSSSSTSALKRPATAPSSSSSSLPTPSVSNGRKSVGNEASSSNSEQTFLAPKRLKLEEIKLSPMGPPPSVSILKKANTISSLAVQHPPPPQQQPQLPVKKTYKQIEEEEAQMEIDSNVLSTTYTVLNDDDDDEVDGPEEEPPKIDALPAGFFDDAKEDAKARGIEYKNPDEAEWDKFVKEIASEDVKSSVLRTADEEFSAKDRELDEIEEQMKNWQRVVELERKATEARQKLLQDREANHHEKMNMSDDEDLDEDYDDDLDWRTKKKH